MPLTLTPQSNTPEPQYVSVEQNEEQEQYEEVEFTEEEIQLAAKYQEFLPEAAVSLNVPLYGSKGGSGQITFRGFHIIAIRSQLEKSMALLKQYGFHGAPQNAQSKQEKIVSAESRTQPESGSNITVLESGSDVLHEIMVSPGLDKPISFKVGRFKYAFLDSRDRERILKNFDPEIGFTLENLINPAVYTQANWKNPLWADWERVEKVTKDGEVKRYYNITYIHY